jgi:tRNA A37 threonylcarbamoyladenosine synthetase subunit TsaC/SUA5/YrdC
LNSNQIILAQTDTTVGFLSSSQEALKNAKQRDDSKPFLMVVDSFKELQKITRVNKNFKKIVRNSKKTTFIYPNQKSIRVVFDSSSHYNLLKKFHRLYSSSANLTNHSFEYNYAYKNASIIVEDKFGLSEKEPSKIYRLYKKKKKRLR